MKKENISEATTEEEEEEEIMEEEDPFNRLPNELIVLILSKIVDAKLLCWVSLVCTRFASLILQTKTKVVIMKIPASKNPPNNQSLSQKLFNFLTKPLYRFFLNAQLSFLTTPNPNLHAVANFLSKFRSLEILLVQAPHTSNDNSSILKWKAHFKPSGITRILILFAEKETAASGYQKYMQLGCDLFMDILMGYQGFWFMVANNPNLTVQWAEITETENSGRIYLDQAQIVEMTNSQPKMSVTFKFSLLTVPLPAGYHEFKEVKIALFNTHVSDEEPNAFEAENLNIIEILEDIQTQF